MCRSQPAGLGKGDRCQPVQRGGGAALGSVVGGIQSVPRGPAYRRRGFAPAALAVAGLEAVLSIRSAEQKGSSSPYT